ncbi:MAG: four helix bundle protein [Lentisphaeria bacterium]|nr:four helix bundle protein [Lentisphaeria bacterium]
MALQGNIIVCKSKKFALQIIDLYKFLCFTKHEKIMFKQLLRSGTSIGANIKEAIRGQSKLDFYAKLAISLKEASETEYWLELLHESNYISEEKFKEIYTINQELIAILVAILKNKDNTQKKRCGE